MTITFQLKVKFRAFFRDWFKYEGQYAVAVSGSGITWREQELSQPGPMARHIVDERGVLLVVW